MRINVNQVTLIMVGSLIWASCTKVLPYQEDFEPSIVVIGGINAQTDTHKITVGQSISPLEGGWQAESPALENVTFKISKNGQEYNTTHELMQAYFFDKGHYYQVVTSGLKAEFGDEIELEVVHSEFASAYSKVEGIRPINDGISVKKGRQDIEDEWGGLYHEFILEFDDPGGKEDYYILEWNDVSGRTQEHQFIQSISSGFSDFEEESSSYQYVGYYTEPFSDEFFDGKHVTWAFEIDGYYWDNWGKVNQQFRQNYTVGLKKISKEYYEFLRAERQQMYSDPVMSEPVVILSNIENGLGVFGIEQTYELEKPE